MNNWINISSIVTYTLVTIVFTYSIISMFLYWKNFRVFVLENKIIIQKGRLLRYYFLSFSEFIVTQRIKNKKIAEPIK